MCIALRLHIAANFTTTALAPLANITSLPAQTVRVGENVRVARGLERRPLVEPHLATHPVNPNLLLASAIVSDAAGGDLGAGPPTPKSVPRSSRGTAGGRSSGMTSRSRAATT